MKITILLCVSVLLFLNSCKFNEGKTTHTIKTNEILMLDSSEIKQSYYSQNFKFKHQDFEAFYTQFIKDSLFQLARTKFPIKGCYSDYEGDQQWKKTAWPMIKWDLRNELNSSQDSISIQQSNTDFFFGEYCLDCGFSYEMKFQKENNTWLLVYRQENNF